VPDDVHVMIPSLPNDAAQKLETDWIKRQEAEIEAM